MAMRAIRRRCRDQRGFTLIETMAAALIMAVAFLGLAGVHTLSSRAQSLGNNRGLATIVGHQDLEAQRRQEFKNIDSGTYTKSVEGVTFTVLRLVTTPPMAKRVLVYVLWADRMGVQLVNLTSLVSQVTNP
jgi:prepilin-type N-terminal cleavage/methylation domain-containing protein